VNITLANIDLQNLEHVEHAIGSLRAYASIPAAFLSTMTDITLDFSGGDTVLTPAPAADPSYAVPNLEEKLGIYGKMTRELLRCMVTLATASEKGTVTLEEASDYLGISLDTARANLRNAGRTAAARKVSLPLIPAWNAEKGYNEYRIAGAKRAE
jgi:hypothetical protein